MIKTTFKVRRTTRILSFKKASWTKTQKMEERILEKVNFYKMWLELGDQKRLV